MADAADGSEHADARDGDAADPLPDLIRVEGVPFQDPGVTRTEELILDTSFSNPRGYVSWFHAALVISVTDIPGRPVIVGEVDYGYKGFTRAKLSRENRSFRNAACSTAIKYGVNLIDDATGEVVRKAEDITRIAEERAEYVGASGSVHVYLLKVSMKEVRFEACFLCTIKGALDLSCVRQDSKMMLSMLRKSAKVYLLPIPTDTAI